MSLSVLEVCSLINLSSVRLETRELTVSIATCMKLRSCKGSTSSSETPLHLHHSEWKMLRIFFQ